MTKPPNPSPKDYVLHTGTVHIHVTPYGFINYAADFFDAATQFKTSRPFSPVPYYLLCHSIELSLKSFLAAKGVSKKDLKYKFGHHLIKLLTQARQLGIEQLVAITPDWFSNLGKADDYYSSKELEYFEITNAATAYPRSARFGRPHSIGLGACK